MTKNCPHNAFFLYSKNHIIGVTLVVSYRAGNMFSTALLGLKTVKTDENI